ncbi:MAG: penicillin-binding protein 2 [Gammaproteobacteria bacterium]|nr:penicillin-binding protein 2 [Gammaproteobacteria bacterium]
MARKPRRDIFFEKNLFVYRAIQVAVMMVICFGALAARLVYVQQVEHHKYVTESERNRIRVRASEPVRGRIFDATGAVVAENQHSYQLVLSPSEIDDLDDTIERLGNLIEIKERDIQRFIKLRRVASAFDAIPLRGNLTDEEIARLAVVNHKFPGVDITDTYDRYYPLGSTYAHIVGYIGRINDRELEANKGAWYSSSAYIGKTGLERFYERQLRGTPGIARQEVNASGKTVRILEETKPIPGRDFYLTIDHRAQDKAIAVLGKETGALVAVDPRDGAVLAMASTPVFDSNLFLGGISVADYRRLADDPERPLYDRTVLGQYPPGSTIKPHIVLQALAKNVVPSGYSINCPGYYMLPDVDHRYRDWAKWGHGRVNLTDSIEQSCDVMFYDLAFNMGIDRLSAGLKEFGLGEKTGIDQIGERSGLVPTRDWKQSRRGQKWFPGETIITGIGQGYMMATPLQLAYSTALIASRGKTPRPHLQAGYRDNLTGVYRPFTPEPHAYEIKASKSQWDMVEKAMFRVTAGGRGTARKVFAENAYRIAGKTGTAQVFSIAQDSVYNADAIDRKLRDHALFVAYAPIEDPQIAVSVLIEHGGSGGSVAAPIAKRFLDYYLLELQPLQQQEREAQQ